MAGLRPHLRPLSFPNSPAGVNPVGLPQRRPPPAPTTPPRSILNEAHAQKEKEKNAALARPRQYMPPTPGQHDNKNSPKRFTFDSMSAIKSELAKKAEKRYSPYENQMQRAQAANRAQMFLNKINGEREERCLQSFKKSESDGQLLPVKDHRKSQSRRKSSRSSSHKHVSTAGTKRSPHVSQNVRVAPSRQPMRTKFTKGGNDSEAVQLPLIMKTSPTFEEIKHARELSSPASFRLQRSRCISDQNHLLNAVANFHGAANSVDNRVQSYAHKMRKKSISSPALSQAISKEQEMPSRREQPRPPPPRPRPRPQPPHDTQRRHGHGPNPHRPRPQHHAQPRQYRGSMHRSPPHQSREHVYAQYAGSLGPRAGGAPRVYDGGSRVYDGGARVYDGGARVYDGGGRVYDGGARVYDGGSRVYDGGARVYDRGAGGASRPDSYASPNPPRLHGADYYTYALDDERARHSRRMSMNEDNINVFDAATVEHDPRPREYTRAPRTSRASHSYSKVRSDRARDPQSARGKLQRYDTPSPKDKSITKIIVQVDNTRLRDSYRCTLMLRLVDTARSRDKSQILDTMPQSTETSERSNCPRFQRNAFCFKLATPLSPDSCEKIVLRIMKQGEGVAKTEHGVGVLLLSAAAQTVAHSGSFTKTVTFTMKSDKAADDEIYIGSTDVSVGKLKLK